MNVSAIRPFQNTYPLSPVSAAGRAQSPASIDGDRFEGARESANLTSASTPSSGKRSKGLAIADALIESFAWFGAGTAMVYPAFAAATALSFGAVTGLGCLAYFGIKWAINGEIS